MLGAETVVISSYWLDFRQLQSQSTFSPQETTLPYLCLLTDTVIVCDPQGNPHGPGCPAVGHCTASVSPDGASVFWLEELCGSIG